MKLATYLDGRPRVGAVVDGGVVDLSGRFGSMLELIEGGGEALEEARAVAAGSGPAARLDEVRLLAPIPQPRRNVFCMGWNYLTHFEEGRGRREGQGEELPEYPTFFDKPTTTVIGPHDDIPFDPNFSEKIDYEAELAVVIGRSGRSIPAGEAMDHVFGYTAANDVTARDVQRRHGGQWLKGKGMDGSCPLGPWIVTADEIPDVQNLQVQCRVNGVQKQNSNTRFMVFPVARLIEELSLAMTLLPGDVLLTGTPEGVGYARTPPEFLRPGDEVTVYVEGVGEISNRVVEKNLTR
ncbi:5-carboxymethyl-2-hydroxymuconate delta-isomerase [Rubrobacter xylanophilus DSM 9941]|uniref:5-carboxymethyl-2-hydroxymuconate delta-isomerase n=1 Tax=Rubrobacter xylanophilus (strain DSM 9941 / JCM 11954 / NBRC 16129 / PRD-1) TaxID=266117 RepID=Q1AZJ6_RUBXD|nr:fumarylacetoacetate hydrolase family protein [Rubrobacter xylanophilus]ABG03182.1 5-carboxymethyl-2-hydroxymuconate delta-isomerase [Rubrobacter xylanophilus DSM 9941]